MYFGYFEVVRSERGLLLYLFLSTFLMEIILRWQSGQAFFASGLFFICLFVMAFIFLSMAIFHLVPRRLSRILIRIWFLLLTLGFVSQFVYFSIFRTYFTFYSMVKGVKAFSFYKIIIIYMLRDLRWLLLLLPYLVFLFIKRRLVWEPQGGFIDHGLVFVLIVLVIVTSLGMSDNADFSARSLIASSKEPVVGVNKLGVLGNAYGELRRQVLPQKNPYYPPGETILPRPGENVSYDLGAFLSEEEDPLLSEITSYLLSRKASDKNSLSGRLKGYNVIYVIAESFSDYAVDKELTPTLYKLLEGSVDFENFYNPLWGVSTTDGEYAALTGLLPVSGIWSMVESRDNYLPQTLANQLNREGYSSYAFHNHDYKYYYRNETHPNLGYDFYALGSGLDVERTWPESDLEMMEKSLPLYIDQEPFNAYYLTVSGHMPYDFVNNAMSKKHEDKVEKLNLSTEAKAYLAAHIELDEALAYLVSSLEERGLMERTLIVLHGDHYPYGLRDRAIEELRGEKLEEGEEYRSRIIFYNPSLQGLRVKRLATSLDLLPTISNLMGLDFDSRLLMGRDLFSYSQPLVEFVTRSFITERGSYDSIDGRSQGLEKEELEELRVLVDKKFYYSRLILESDYFRKLEAYRLGERELLPAEEEEAEE